MHPSIFSPGYEKKFYNGLRAYAKGDLAGASGAFAESARQNPNMSAPQVFDAIIALKQGNTQGATQKLEWLVQNAALPDALLAKYGGVLGLQVSITERITVSLPISAVGLTLMLAELYQKAGRLEEAIGLVQQLHEAAPNDLAIRLSLADLLYEDGDTDGVVELAVGAVNDADVSLALLHLKAKALLLAGMGSAAASEFTSCLRKTSGRDPDLLRAIRYDRASAYDQLGQHAKARADWEKVYAEQPDYLDVKEKLRRS